MCEANFGPLGISSPWSSYACFPLVGKMGFCTLLLFQLPSALSSIWLLIENIKAVQFSAHHLNGVSSSVPSPQTLSQWAGVGLKFPL